MLFGLYLSFTDYDLLSPPLWVGFDNFVNLFSDRLFRNALRDRRYSCWGPLCRCGCCRCWPHCCSTRLSAGAISEGNVLPTCIAARGVVAVVWRVSAASERCDYLARWRPLGSNRNSVAGRCGAGAAVVIAVHDWAAIPIPLVIWLAGLAGRAGGTARGGGAWTAPGRCGRSGTSS